MDFYKGVFLRAVWVSLSFMVLGHVGAVCASVFDSNKFLGQKNTENQLPLIVLVDEIETEDNGFTALTQTLGMAFKYKKSPIITTTSLLDLFLKKASYSLAVTEIKNAKFLASEWDIYHKKETALWLLIPKSFGVVSYNYLLEFFPGLRVEGTPFKVDQSESVQSLNNLLLAQKVDEINKQRKAQQRSVTPSDFKAYLFNRDDVLLQLQGNPLFTQLIDEHLKEEKSKIVPASSNTRAGLYSLSQSEKDAFVRKQKENEIVEAYRSSFPAVIPFIMGHGTKNERIVGFEIKKFQEFAQFFNNLHVSFGLFLSCYIGGSNRSFIINQNAPDEKQSFKSLKYPFLIVGSGENIVDAKPLLSDNFGKFFDSITAKNDPNWISELISYFSLYKGHSTVNALNVGQLFIPGNGFFSFPQIHGKLQEGSDELKVLNARIVVLGDVTNKKSSVHSQLMSNTLKRLKTLEDKTPAEHTLERTLEAQKITHKDEIAIEAATTQLVLLQSPFVKTPLVIKKGRMPEGWDEDDLKYPRFLPMYYFDSHASLAGVPGGTEGAYIFDSIKLEDFKTSLTKQGIFNFITQSFGSSHESEQTLRFMVKRLEGVNDFSSFIPKDAAVGAQTDPLLKELQALLAKSQSSLVLENVFIQQSPVKTLYGKIKFKGYISFKCDDSYWMLVIPGDSSSMQVYKIPAFEWNNVSLTDEELFDVLKNKLVTFNFIFSSIFSKCCADAFVKEMLKFIFPKTTQDAELVASLFSYDKRQRVLDDTANFVEQVLEACKEGSFGKVKELVSSF